LTKPAADPFPKARRENLVVSQLDDETIIYDKQTHQATCLNSFAAQVWRLCNGRRTPADIAQTVNDDEVEIHSALGKLSLGGLLSKSNDIPLSGRRGFLTGATAGLAAVTSMVIPSPAAAASAPGGLPKKSPCGTTVGGTMGQMVGGPPQTPDPCAPGLVCSAFNNKWRCRT